MKEDPEILNALLKDKPPADILAYFLDKYKGKVVLGSSLSAEDQVLTDMIVKIDKNAKIFTLDTGRLFPETYELIEKTNRTYDINIGVYFPDTEKVEKMVKEKGINLFYKSVENRKLCCYIRKIEPSKRALHGMRVWTTGIRKDQTVSRFFNKHVEWDDENNLLKINPLLNWTEKQVWEYIKSNQVPYNELHDKGFPSIGCMPCTRAVKPGEDARSGRWWWEDAGPKECGLHNRKRDYS
ncbi:MAG TPA: phosphoadenylyl-sulfate reductase [Bacteroidales bacterium]|nr:phosphoadenylyl-sulfate reductase [Bacteroidales bacterium]